MHRSRSTLGAIPPLLACALLAACAHEPRTKVTRGARLSAPLAVRMALVGPVALRWEEPSGLLAFARAQDVAAAVAARGQLAVLGPGQLGSGPGGGLQEIDTADLARVALRRDLRLDEVLVVRAWAERRVASVAARLTDAQGRAAGAASAAEVTLVAHVEVSHPATHALLAEVLAEAASDPAAEHPALDAQPELGPLLRAATEAALAALAPALRLPPPVDTGLVLAAAPGPAMSYATKGLRSLRETLRGQDELAQDLALENALAVLAPGLEDAEARALRRAQVGLLVREASGRAARAGLRAGDLIVEVAGGPAAQAHDLLTAALLGGAKVALTVQRGSERIELGY